jgi:perosamine synthetase
MKLSARKAYCGPAGLELRNIIGIKTRDTIYSCFEGSNVIYVHKGRTAIKIACEFLGIGPDSEVLAPSYNCGSEIDALLSSGTAVILYRVDRGASIDDADLESRITNRTKAIYVTHYFGFPHSLENIKKICTKNNLYLIEDCALALFSRHNNKMIGTTGNIAIFSLPKTLSVPDGGVLLINNIAKQETPLSLSQPKMLNIFLDTLPLLKAGLQRRFAFHQELKRLYEIYTKKGRLDCRENDGPNMQVRNDIPQSYYYIDQYNNKDMSLFTKHLIKTFDPNEVKEKRRRNYKALSSILGRNPGIAPLYKELPDQTCPLNFPIIVDNRDAIVQKLSKKQIDARSWWCGYHNRLKWSEFPDACYLKDKIMTLPVHQSISDNAIEYMAECIEDAR